MKKTLLFLLAACPSLLFAQEKYVIKGKLGNLGAPAKIFLVYNVGTQRVTDSSAVKNGVFEMAGQVDDITQAVLVMDYKGTGLQSFVPNAPVDSAPVFLEQGTITISSTDSLYKAKFTGTRANEDYDRYKVAIKPLNEAVKALNAEYASAPVAKQGSQEFRDYLIKKQSALQQQAKDINNKFIADNPDSYIGLQTLIDAMNSEAYPDAQNLQIRFSGLTKALRESKAGVAYQKRLDAMKSVSVGAIAPDFAQPDTSGVPVKLSSFKGKYVFLDFWASWCGPCRNENPNVVKAYNKYKGENFTILSVSLDQTGKKSDWLKAIHDDGLTWNHVSDLKFWANDAALLYSVRAIPQNFLIDPSGKIIARNIFGDDLQKKLAEIFNKM